MLPADEAWPPESLLGTASNPNPAHSPPPEAPTQVVDAAHPQAAPSPLAPSAFHAFERVPTDYLIAAKGDLEEAAQLAGTDTADLLRALGSDRALPQAAKAIHFLTLMKAHDLVVLAAEEITHRFTHSPDPEDDPTSSAYDPTVARAAATIPMKDLLGIFKFSADFIAMANVHENPPVKGLNRHVPPLRGAILEAARGLPGAATTEPAIPADPTPDEQAFISNLRERLDAADPRVRALFATALEEASEDEEEE